MNPIIDHTPLICTGTLYAGLRNCLHGGKGGKLKFKSRRFILDVRKKFLVESWLRSCTCTIVTKFPQDIIGCFPFTDIKREMKHSVSKATRYGPSWRHELKFMSGGGGGQLLQKALLFTLY